MSRYETQRDKRSLENSCAPSDRADLCSPRRTRGLSAHSSHLPRKKGISSVWQNRPFHSLGLSDSYRDGSEMGLCSFGHQKTNEAMKEETVWSYTTLMNSPFRMCSQAASVFSAWNQRDYSRWQVQFRLWDTQGPHPFSFKKELNLFCSGKEMYKQLWMKVFSYAISS